MKTDQSADAHGFARRGICILYATVSVQLPEIPDTGKNIGWNDLCAGGNADRDPVNYNVLLQKTVISLHDTLAERYFFR